MNEWLNELSQKLGRSTEELARRSLNAYDFPLHDEVHLEFEDGSSAIFLSAFFLSDEKRRAVAVFTEHCGYHVFGLPGLELRLVRQP